MGGRGPGGGLPMLPGLYLSTFQPSQQGFFRVHTVRLCEGRESLSPNFQTFQDPINSNELVDLFCIVLRIRDSGSGAFLTSGSGIQDG
jgi:hypothetical protein